MGTLEKFVDESCDVINLFRAYGVLHSIGFIRAGGSPAASDAQWPARRERGVRLDPASRAPTQDGHAFIGFRV